MAGPCYSHSGSTTLLEAMAAGHTWHAQDPVTHHMQRLWENGISDSKTTLWQTPFKSHYLWKVVDLVMLAKPTRSTLISTRYVAHIYVALKPKIGIQACAAAAALKVDSTVRLRNTMLPQVRPDPPALRIEGMTREMVRLVAKEVVDELELRQSGRTTASPVISPPRADRVSSPIDIDGEGFAPGLEDLHSPACPLPVSSPGVVSVPSRAPSFSPPPAKKRNLAIADLLGPQRSPSSRSPLSKKSRPIEATASAPASASAPLPVKSQRASRSKAATCPILKVLTLDGVIEVRRDQVAKRIVGGINVMWNCAMLVRVWFHKTFDPPPEYQIGITVGEKLHLVPLEVLKSLYSHNGEAPGVWARHEAYLGQCHVTRPSVPIDRVLIFSSLSCNTLRLSASQLSRHSSEICRIGGPSKRPKTFWPGSVNLLRSRKPYKRSMLTGERRITASTSKSLEGQVYCSRDRAVSYHDTTIWRTSWGRYHQGG